MSRQVLITTPVLTLDEVAQDLGVSKARLDSIMRIMKGSRAGGRRVGPAMEIAGHQSNGPGSVPGPVLDSRKN